MEGFGRYDAEARDALAATHAEGLVLVVFEGNQGHGASVLIADSDDSSVVVLRAQAIAKTLRSLADAMDREAARLATKRMD